MEKNKKAISLILEAIDLLQDLKFMYAKPHLFMAINEIKKVPINIKKAKKNKIKSMDPAKSLKMVENIIKKEKKYLENNK